MRMCDRCGWWAGENWPAYVPIRELDHKPGKFFCPQCILVEEVTLKLNPPHLARKTFQIGSHLIKEDGSLDMEAFNRFALKFIL